MPEDLDDYALGIMPWPGDWNNPGLHGVLTEDTVLGEQKVGKDGCHWVRDVIHPFYGVVDTVVTGFIK